MAKLKIIEIEGIYAGETFSRAIELSIDGVVQELANYVVTYEVFKSSLTTSSTATQEVPLSTGIADSGVVVIDADTTANMSGWYIIKVTMDLAGVKTIRKAKFNVEN